MARVGSWPLTEVMQEARWNTTSEVTNGTLIFQPGSEPRHSQTVCLMVPLHFF